MLEILGKRFFRALQREAESQLGQDHPCVLAAARAADTEDESDIETARQELAALPAAVSDVLMERVHKVMREDPEALLDLWAGRGDPSRRN